MLTQLREIGKTDNEGVCKMPYEARAKIMAEYRNKFRAPNRKSVRPAAKEFNLLWDADDNGNQPSTEQILAADAARKLMAAKSGDTDSSLRAKLTAAGVSPTSWTFLGPGNIGGRVRSVAIDPRNASRILVASVTGGIWISTNGGQSFSPVTDLLSNIAFAAMALTPGNPDVIYAGTGESFQGFNGIGMFKSLDSGLTWTFLSATSTSVSADWVYVNRIAVSPANPSIVLAANNGGLYRSVNAGVSWTKVLVGTPAAVTGGTIALPAMLDVKFDPNSTNNALASGVDGYVYFSRDAGATWQPSIQLLAPTLTLQPRAELAYSKATPGMAYVSLDHSSGELWRTTDGGQTWALVSNPAHLGTQGSYANTIWVDPVNDANIVVGGLDLYRSIDSGASFIKISTWQFAGPGLTQPHADHHTIVAAPDYSPANQVVYFGNDGGLYRSTNILTADANTTSSWVNLNNSLGVTQFYGGAGKRSAGGMVIGGTQDNGTIYQVSGTNWDRFAGGDGGFVAVDPVSDNTLYGEYVYASIHRTIGLGSRQYICSGITEGKKSEGGNTYCGANATEQTNFISPFILDPNDRNRMLVGAASLWVTTNVQATPPTWTSIKSPITLAGNSRPYINAIAVQESNSNVIWVGVNGATSTGGQGGYVYKTINGLAVAPTWQLVSTSNLPTSTVTRITIDPTNPNRVWVVYSGFSTNRLWETTDGGTSWHSLTSNLPAITLYDIKRHPTQSNWLYVGAANGVYTSQDGGATWSTTTDGPSGVRVRELFWYDSQTLIAATFGRGMFLATAAAPTGPPLPPSKRGGIDFDGQGKSQLVIRNGNGQMQAGRFANSTFTFTPIGDPGSGYRILGTSDLNWNGKSDLLFQDTATPGDFGDASTWLDFDSNQQRLVRSVKRVWDVQAVGDLDGDGFGDLVWRYVVADSPDTGVSYIWFTAGAPNTSGPNVTQVRKRGGAPLDWRLLGALDLNNDGAADMLYLSPANQLKALMATPNRTCANLSAGTVPSGFTVLKFADFTGNQRGDVLIRDAAGNTKLLSLNANGLTLPPYAGAPDDQNASCTASSLVVVSTTINLPVADPTWTYYASGDFDGDGIFDVVWRLPNGSLTVWLMKANGVPAVVSNAGTVPAGFAPIPLQ